MGYRFNTFCECVKEEDEVYYDEYDDIDKDDPYDIESDDIKNIIISLKQMRRISMIQMSTMMIQVMT